MSGSIEYLSFFAWPSVCMITSRSIHVAANCRISLFFNGWLIFPCVCVCVCVCVCKGVYYFIFISSSVMDTWIASISINNAAVNIGIHISFPISAFVLFRYILNSVIARSMAILFLLFWAISLPFSLLSVPIYWYNTFSPTAY